ncbi:GntR family transcriptional regulator [Streptomyces lydicus]|uniref:GntR family transcriptional regulator n=1 Tax=Streptomyces lydicus TaxID=47763 RepID=UPI0010111B4A|nr:GntR family transcriptional regulator [Streptomyces lydicus]MCZ1006733.1 GntR family transcriptional regulator [Streptomyces lydicus]
MTTASTDHTDARALDLSQLRDDLAVLRRISGHGRSAPASVARNLDMARRIALHWAPFGQARRTAADDLASEERRWDLLLACAAPERSVEKSFAAVMVYASSVRDLVQALHDVALPGTAVPDVSRAITAAISKGDFPVGFELRVKQVAADLRTPVERVRTAVSSLLDSGALESRGRRIFPAGSLDLHDDLATHIADRLHAQIAAGVYARGSRLPNAKFLATTFCNDAAPVGQALRVLVADGVVHIGPCGTTVLQPACPSPPAHQYEERSSRFSRDTIVATCRAAHVQWHHRRPAPAEVLHERWQDLRSMASQLLAAAPPPAPDAAQELAALARATELVSAPLPDKPWLQQWHTACQAKSISDILPLVPKEPR